MTDANRIVTYLLHFANFVTREKGIYTVFYRTTGIVSMPITS